jgi:hypothetical protein
LKKQSQFVEAGIAVSIYIECIYVNFCAFWRRENEANVVAAREPRLQRRTLNAVRGTQYTARGTTQKLLLKYSGLPSSLS